MFDIEKFYTKLLKVNGSRQNKRKIVNDPVYGFINIPDDIIFDLIEHPYFQRLRRIKQLGLTHLVYPGALHTRFHHAMGGMFLMTEALKMLKLKGKEISKDEYNASVIAILLHDIGHGPFSHSLENSIVYGMSHEDLSMMFMNRLNGEFNGALDLAIKIFNNTYERKFFHQLISSQLDMDRMDYLKRDCFYTGVTEGNISSDRIIDMLDVVNDELVVEAKGIYSIENFIIARRLMYWQVYLHKTVIAAEKLLINVLKRASQLANKGVDLFATPALKEFLYNRYEKTDFEKNSKLLDLFSQLDDNDIVASIKVWMNHPDEVLSYLCRNMINRRLYKIRLLDKEVSNDQIQEIGKKVQQALNIDKEDLEYFVFSGRIMNNAYDPTIGKINILMKDKSVKDIAEASDHLNISTLSESVVKSFICFPSY